MVEQVVQLFYGNCSWVVGIVSSCGLRIEAHCRNQPSKTNIVLCKLLLHFKSPLKQLYIGNKIRWSASVIKVGVTYVCTSRRLIKDELVQTID